MADQVGEEVLERRYDAWCRLLTTFRVVFGCIYHENLHLFVLATWHLLREISYYR